MSNPHITDIANHGTAICVAALGLAGASASSFAIGAMALSAIGFQIVQSHKKTCETAAKRVMRDMQASGALDPDVLATANKLLTTGHTTVSVTRLDLPKAAAQEDFYSAIIDQLMQSFPKDADPDAISLIRIVMGSAFTACRHVDDFHKPLQQSLLVTLVRGQEAIRDDIAGVRTEVSRMREDLDQREQALVAQTEKLARNLHLQEGLLIGVARRYSASNPDDFDSALAGVEQALEVAARERAQGRLSDNLPDAINDVFARVDALNDVGQIDEGKAALLAAMAEQRDLVAQAQAGQLRLIAKGLTQAVLTRDVDMAVTLELERLALDAAGFDALRDARREWYERGRDKGLRFDLEVAIALAEVSAKQAEDADQRGVSANDLGIALWTLGEREGGTLRLEDAVTAYTRALGERTQDRVPLDWAMTQNNLGVALQTLGRRESGTVRLEEAVTAYTRALEEYTQDCVPLDWAATQNNLGIALWTLGVREGGTLRIEDAVTAYTHALGERTQDRVPLDWAATQNNLGNALTTLGRRESGTVRLEEAVTAYTRALEERMQDSVPLNWAMTMENLASVEQAFAKKTDGSEQERHVRAALTYVEAALQVYDPESSPYYFDKASAFRKDLLDALQQS